MRGVGGRSLNQSGSAPIQKPFSDYRPAPTVSPYVNLERDETNSALPTYQTLVEPFLQQQAINQQQQIDIQRINRQFQNVRSQTELQQSQQQLNPTGHVVYFNNLMNYFPRRR